MEIVRRGEAGICVVRDNVLRMVRASQTRFSAP
jgi:hypothetical protein